MLAVMVGFNLLMTSLAVADGQQIIPQQEQPKMKEYDPRQEQRTADAVAQKNILFGIGTPGQDPKEETEKVQPIDPRQILF